MSTRTDYLEWVQVDLRALAHSKFPNNSQAQILYQLGFLQRQLAEAMYTDSHAAKRFSTSIKAAAQLDQELA